MLDGVHKQTQYPGARPCAGSDLVHKGHVLGLGLHVRYSCEASLHGWLNWCAEPCGLAGGLPVGPGIWQWGSASSVNECGLKEHSGTAAAAPLPPNFWTHGEPYFSHIMHVPSSTSWFCGKGVGYIQEKHSIFLSTPPTQLPKLLSHPHKILKSNQSLFALD